MVLSGAGVDARPLSPHPLSPQHIRALFDPLSGHLWEIQNLDKGISLPVFQSFYW